jgi:hypothetical protein
MSLTRRVRSPPESPTTVPSLAAAVEPVMHLSPIAEDANLAYRRLLKREELRRTRKPIRWIAVAAFGVCLSMVLGTLFVSHPDGQLRKPSRLRKRACTPSEAAQPQDVQFSTESTVITTSSG